MILESEFPPDIRVENEIESLVEAGNFVIIACYAKKNEKLIEKKENHLIVRFPRSDFFKKKLSAACLTLPFYFVSWKKFLSKIVEKYQIEVIHIHDLPLAKVGYLLKKKYNLHFVLDMHENFPAAVKIYKHTNTLQGKILSPYKKWLSYENSYVKEADRIIVVVEEAKTRFNKLIDDKKIYIVSNTLNLNSFDEIETKKNIESNILFFAGMINQHRGLQIVLKAISILKERQIDIIFQIAGTGSYVSELKKIVTNLDIEKNVIFLGWKTRKEISSLLSQASFTIIPHLKSEHTDTTIPHKIFQYMYANRFIISSNCKPLERIINKTNAGLIYQSNSANDLADKIELGIAEISKEDFSLSTRKIVEDKYNWKIDGENLVRLYNSLGNNG